MAGCYPGGATGHVPSPSYRRWVAARARSRVSDVDAGAFAVCEKFDRLVLRLYDAASGC